MTAPVPPLAAGIPMFGLASLACVLSPSIGALIGFRVLETATGVRLEASDSVPGFVVCGLCGLAGAVVAQSIPRPAHAPHHT